MSRASKLPLFDSSAENPVYGVRTSARSRRLTLRVYPGGRVEVTVPTKTPDTVITEFVAKHRAWINQRVLRARERAPVSIDLRPTQVELRALNETWQVEYVAQSRRPWEHNGAEQRRVRVRDALDPSQCGAHLRAWLRHVANERLDGWLKSVAQHYDFRYTRMQVRQQQTRWGSCSRSGTISLNVCLLFQASEVVRYLLLHELCHTRHMNHSNRFWELVAQCEPEWRVLDRELSSGWQHVPGWVFA